MKWALLAVVGAGVMAMAYVVWVVTLGTPLVVEVRDGEVLVDTQVFGEYYSSISRIRVTESASGRTVWEVESTNERGTSPLWYFVMKSGKNSQPKRLQEFQGVTPRGDAEFELVPGREYRIRVWGETRLNRNSRRFTVNASVGDLEATYDKSLNLPLACANVVPAG